MQTTFKELAEKALVGKKVVNIKPFEFWGEIDAPCLIRGVESFTDIDGDRMVTLKLDSGESYTIFEHAQIELTDE